MRAVVDCPGCERPHESIHSAAQHHWKSQDEKHDADTLDEALVAVVEHNERMHMTDSDDDTVTNGNGTVETDSTDESDEQPPTVNDGDERTTPDGNDGTAPEGADTTGDGAVTDGSGRFPTPSPADDATTPDRGADDGDHGDDGTEPCPGCGEPIPVDGVEPGVYNCSACGHRVRVTA